MTETTGTPREGAKNTYSHVCPDCGKLHQVVPTCVLCDDIVQMRRHWYEMGFDQAKREAKLEHKAERETLLQRITELGGAR